MIFVIKIGNFAMHSGQFHVLINVMFLLKLLSITELEAATPYIITGIAASLWNILSKLQFDANEWHFLHMACNQVFKLNWIELHGNTMMTSVYNI